MRQNKPSFNPADTNALVGAVAFGKGLSKCRPPGPVAPGHPGQGPMMSTGPTLQQVTIGVSSGQQAGMGGPVAPPQQGQPGRRPGDYFYIIFKRPADFNHVCVCVWLALRSCDCAANLLMFICTRLHFQLLTADSWHMLRFTSEHLKSFFIHHYVFEFI